MYRELDDNADGAHFKWVSGQNAPIKGDEAPYKNLKSSKLLTLFEELTEHPFTGTGKPESLKHEFSGYWSRRINKEHRLIYSVSENTVYINTVFGHYL